MVSLHTSLFKQDEFCILLYIIRVIGIERKPADPVGDRTINNIIDIDVWSGRLLWMKSKPQKPPFAAVHHKILDIQEKISRYHIILDNADSSSFFNHKKSA